MTHVAETFRALHQPGNPLVMINVWDAGTAKVMAGLGAKALATSSAAHAYIMGEPDGGTVTRDDALHHAEEIVAASGLPVQGDFENGFGDSPDVCAETVRLAAEVGLAGICIEDTMFPTGDAYEFDLAVERMATAAAAASALPHDFVLTARADGILTGRYDTAEAIRRLQAFDTAGADCLYAPLPPGMATQQKLVACTEKPVNALVAGHFTKNTRADFAKIGVARLSIGSSLARATQRLIYDAGKAMIDEGDFKALAHGISSAKVDALLKGE